MSVYRGTMDPNHLRAVIRVALRSHGFSASRTELERANQEQWQLGCWLRDQALPDRFPEFFDVTDYRAVEQLDPYLWNRLPRMAGLGFQQAAALHGLAPVAPEVDTVVALIGAAFNSAIAVLDYLIDECQQETLVFEALSPKMIRGIFESSEQTQQALASAYKLIPDARLRLLLTLVATCAAGGRELHMYSGNVSTWTQLADMVMRLYEAERTVSRAFTLPPESGDELLTALETKSALPSRTLLQLSILASEQSEPTALARQASLVLGEIFLHVDDLVDLLTDCRRGGTSALLLRLANNLATEGRTEARDTDLYDLIDATAGRLVALLQLSALGLEEAVSSDDAESRSPHAALAAVRRFACLTVAAWVGWHEEDPASSQKPDELDAQAGEARGVRTALARLLAYQSDAYREALHYLHFPRLGHQYETHPALLSHRAVALDALLDADAAHLPVPPQVLNTEVMGILRMKHRDVRGGWNYIPEVPELPPDADDLGQVLQVLSRFGGYTLASTCDEGIRLVLDGADPDGGFNTWILDPRGHSPADQAIRAYLSVMGGWGVHPEVVSNLLYGLILSDPVRYRDPLRRAMTYLLSEQEENGSWPSKWYAGPYYGTFRAVSVLACLSPTSEALNRALAFLQGGQNPDGSWGEGEGEPLSTALALLTLAALNLNANEIAVKRGAEHLLRTQERDGGWPAIIWIAFPSLDGPVTYGSRTITTAFCLKALLAVSSMRQ